jgi:hypothetical protein
VEVLHGSRDKTILIEVRSSEDPGSHLDPIIYMSLQNICTCQTESSSPSPKRRHVTSDMGISRESANPPYVVIG